MSPLRFTQELRRGPHIFPDLSVDADKVCGYSLRRTKGALLNRLIQAAIIFATMGHASGFREFFPGDCVRWPNS
jgi:hypothetical protein